MNLSHIKYFIISSYKEIYLRSKQKKKFADVPLNLIKYKQRLYTPHTHLVYLNYLDIFSISKFIDNNV